MNMDYKPKNIFVTGGCGFIGSNFMNIMVKKYPEYNFYNFDCLYYCASLNNIDVSNESNYKFIKGNLSSIELIGFCLKEFNIDTVIHFAAQSHVDTSFSNPLQYTVDNIVGTHNLLEACNKHGGIKRFIHISTDEVYGESDFNEDKKKDEQSVLCPTNPYAATKAAAELLARSYYFSYKLPIIITRGNNVYGPRQYPEKLIPKFVGLLKDNKKCTIHGRGDTQRSFVFVNDVVNAFDIILHKGSVNNIYNIGSCHEHSVLDVTTRIIKILKGTDKYEDYVEFVKDRNFNDKRYYIDDQKLKTLGWEPVVSFDEGLRQVVEWYVSIDNKMHWHVAP
jgi:UDP-glucose 4,6-dehydratase